MEALSGSIMEDARQYFTTDEWTIGHALLAVGLGEYCAVNKDASFRDEAAAFLQRETLPGKEHNGLWQSVAAYALARMGLLEQQEQERLHTSLLEMLEQPRPASAQNTLCLFPFYAWYETAHTKERYNDLYPRLKAAEKCAAEMPAADAQAFLAGACHVLGLLLVWQNSDEEVFEQFALARSLFKQALNRMLAFRQENLQVACPAADCVLAFCIYRATALQGLLADKYLPIAKMLSKPYIQLSGDAAGMGAGLLLHSEKALHTAKGALL